MVKNGQLGEKSGVGFYKKIGKEIQTLNWKTGEYAPAVKPELPAIGKAMRLPLGDRLKAAGITVLHIMGAGVAKEHPYTSAAHLVGGKLSYAQAAG